jgi:hypothetical protein
MEFEGSQRIYIPLGWESSKFLIIETVEDPEQVRN